MPAYRYLDEELRRVSRDAYVSWQASRYSVPWRFAGKEVWVCEDESRVEVHHGSERIASHDKAVRHRTITEPEHHRGIPVTDRRSDGKILVHLRETAPVVEVRPLAVYENAGGLL